MKKFIQNLSYSRSTFIGFGVLVFISLIYIVFDAINGKLDVIDFGVYYFTAQNLLEGANLYNVFDTDSHYIFKYGPPSALFFIPFTIFPYEIAKFIFWGALTGVMIIGIRLCMRILEPSIFSDSKRANKIILLGLLPLILHMTRELHLGQVNHLLMVMYVGALWFLLKERYMPAAFLIAASVFFKPFGLIFIFYLLYKKHFKATAFIILFIALLLFIPYLFWGSWEIFKTQYVEWYSEMMFEMGKKQELIMPENHTIFSVLARYTPFRWLIKGELATMIFQLVVLAGIGIGMLFVIKKGKNVSTINPIVAEYGIIMALIPLLAFTTSNAFGFVQLLVFIVLIHYNKFTRLNKALIITAFIFIGGACSDIIGKKASFFMDDLSLISIGTLILIYLIIQLRKKLIV